MPSLRLSNKPSISKVIISYPKPLIKDDTQLLVDKKLNTSRTRYTNEDDLKERYKDNLIELGVITSNAKKEEPKKVEMTQEQENLTPVKFLKKSHLDDIPHHFMVMCAGSKLCFNDDNGDNPSMDSPSPSARFHPFRRVGSERDESTDYSPQEISYYTAESVGRKLPPRISSLSSTTFSISPENSVPSSPAFTDLTLVHSPVGSTSSFIGDHKLFGNFGHSDPRCPFPYIVDDYEEQINTEEACADVTSS